MFIDSRGCASSVASLGIALTIEAALQRHTILFLAANPSEADWLALDQEAREIQVELERSGHRDRFEFVTRWASQPLDLLRELRRLKPTVVHFSGHGGHRAVSGPSQDGVPRRDVKGGVSHQSEKSQQSLVFQDADGRPQFVSATALEETFGAVGASVKLVVLNACYSDIQAEALAAHVDYVVGVDGSIHDNAARSFAIGFYGGLGERQSIADAYKQGRAAIILRGMYDGDRLRLYHRRGVDPGMYILTDAKVGAQDRNALLAIGVYYLKLGLSGLADRFIRRMILGLNTDDTLSERATIPPSPTGVGHGFMATTIASQDGLSKATIAAILAQPQFTRDPVLSGFGVGPISRWDGDSRLLGLGMPKVHRAFGAAEFVPELGWIVDSRAELAGVTIPLEDDITRATVVSTRGGMVSFYDLSYGVRSVQQFEFAASPTLVLPAIDELLVRLHAPAWLREAVAVRVASESYLRRVASVGLASRLAPSEAETPGKVFDAIAAGGPDPLEALDAWARSLAPELVAFLEAAVFDEAGGLGEELAALATFMVDENPIARSLALSFRIRRDDLESVASVLRVANAATTVVNALAILDTEAASYLSAFDLAGDDLGDPLLSAVAVAQPDAWWGIAGPP